MRCVFLDTDGLEDCNLSELQSVCGSFTSYATTSPDQVEERIHQAELVIVNKVRLERKLLEAAHDLKLICVVATGTDVIDIAAASEIGITVCNCRAYGTDSVVQHVFSLLLALQTNLISYHNDVQAGKWQEASQFCFLDYPIVELAGKNLGIVGHGTLGRGVEKIARAFGMNVLVARRPGAEPDDRPQLSEILPELDVLTLHCPLTDATRGLIGTQEFQAMKSTAILINAARGGIVDEAALASALREGQIGGAAVDVLSVEPPRESNILLELKQPNLIITPHIAWASKEARQRIIDQTVENISRFQAGTPVRVVSSC